MKAKILDDLFFLTMCCSIEVVDKCLLDHFVMELKLLDHLRFVKSVFCHEHPVITPCVLDALFSEVCYGDSFLDPSTLNCFGSLSLHHLAGYGSSHPKFVLPTPKGL